MTIVRRKGREWISSVRRKRRALRLLGYVSGVTSLEVNSLQLWIVETLSNPMSEYFRDHSDLVF